METLALAARAAEAAAALSLDAASTTRLAEAIEEGIKSGRRAAAAMHAADEWSCPLDAPVWVAKRSGRESLWMRSCLWEKVKNRELHHAPFGKTFSSKITEEEAPLIERRSGNGVAARERCRPKIANFVLNGRTRHVVNMSAGWCTDVLQEHGKGSVPCGNPGCCGLGGGAWDTVPIEYSRRAITPVIDALTGLPDPMLVMKSRCNSCNTTFTHDNAVTLQRLEDVPEILRHLPFDPAFPRGKVATVPSIVRRQRTCSLTSSPSRV